MSVCDEPPGEDMQRDLESRGQVGKAWSYWKD
jgi:hypothetical protein